jgi:hypothetical protein
MTAPEESIELARQLVKKASQLGINPFQFFKGSRIEGDLGADNFSAGATTFFIGDAAAKAMSPEEKLEFARYIDREGPEMHRMFGDFLREFAKSARGAIPEGERRRYLWLAEKSRYSPPSFGKRLTLAGMWLRVQCSVVLESLVGGKRLPPAE